MKTTLKMILGLALVITGFQAQALVVTGLSVTDCGLDPNCYAGPSGPPANNPTTAEIEALVGATAGSLFALYKENVGDGFDTGAFASSYRTTFSNSALDPEDALIEYIGGDSITCPECFLLVKDGASAPNWYIFDIGSWNGTDDIVIQDFWIGKGAISHVTIFGAETSVPEPGILALLGIGLIGFRLVRRKA